MVQTTIRMPEKLYCQIKEQAKKRGVSVNSFIITILCEKKVIHAWIPEMKYKRNNIRCTGGGEVKTNVYIRFGDDVNYRNVNTLTDEEKKLAGNKLNQQAAERIVLAPKTA